jgi:hypothetical protein
MDTPAPIDGGGVLKGERDAPVGVARPHQHRREQRERCGEADGKKRRWAASQRALLAFHHHAGISREGY